MIKRLKKVLIYRLKMGQSMEKVCKFTVQRWGSRLDIFLSSDSSDATCPQNDEKQAQKRSDEIVFGLAARYVEWSIKLLTEVQLPNDVSAHKSTLA